MPVTVNVTGFAQFNDYLYLSTEGPQPSQVWRSTDGSNWEPVVTDGFGDPNNNSMGGWAILGDYIYIGTRNDLTGAQLWRSMNGTDWEAITQDGFGDVNNIKIESLYTFAKSDYQIADYLFAITQNNVTGMEVWRSADGIAWSQVNADGFGDSNNFATLWSNASMVYLDQLYVGTWNSANGGEVWVYTPAVTASFTATPTIGVVPLEVTFTNTSTGTLTANLWDFGDGITSTLTSPVHIYDTTGDIYRHPDCGQLRQR